MRTRHLLYLSGLNREAYNTLVRRGHLPFLEKHLGAEGVDRFRPWHALGLNAFVALRSIGVEPSAAAEAVEDSWRDIIRIAGLVDEEPRTHLCGRRLNDIGIIDTWGWPHPKSKGGPPMASVAVDLSQQWELLAAQLPELEVA